MKKKKKIIIILSFSLFILLFVSVYLYFTNTEDLILKKDISINFRAKAYNSDLIEKINGRLLNDPLIDTNTIGKKKVQITYYNHYGFIENKYAEVEIKDITPPMIVVNNPYVIEKGSISKLEDNIFCTDDYDDNVSCQITGDYNLNKVGKYPLKITATDHSNNVTSKSFTLQVKNKETSTTKPIDTKNYFKDIYQKYKKANTLIGIDISKWQGDIDFNKIKEEGVEFVMIKIGGQTKKGGKIEVDPKFKQNITSALATNLKVGVYFYSHATNIKEARNQAKWVLKNISEYEITLPIAFDWENWSKYSTYHISIHSLNNIANTFFTTLEQKNYKTILYSSKYYLENIWYEEEYSNWIAHYTLDDKNKNRYDMWQLCSDGVIEGIEEKVDIDILYKHEK